MVDNEMMKSATEVKYILNRFSTDLLKNIPEDFIQFIDSMAVTTYKFEYDENKMLIDQNLNPKTKSIIAYIYENFCCSQEEKEIYRKKCMKYEIVKDNKAREMYNPDDIFKKENNTIESSNADVSENSTNTSLVEYKESFWAKFKNFIFKILHINN